MKSIELFTGAGGLALGTHIAGFKHVAVVEWNSDACSTLRRNAVARAVPGIDRWDVRQEDIRAVDFKSFPPVDLIAGGVPCQPFSIGGKHRGMDDDRDMFPDFVRAVRTLAPRAFIVENVKGLLRQSFKNYFGYILLQLTHPTIVRKSSEGWTEHLRRLESIHTHGRPSSLRYNVVFRMLNAADYGVPQTRERVFIVGFREDIATEWHFPEPTHSHDALMRDQWVTGDYWKRHDARRPKVSDPRLTNIASMAGGSCAKPWKTIRDVTHDLPRPNKSGKTSGGIHDHRLNPGARTYAGHTGSPLDLPAKTLKAGVHGVPGGENMVVMPNGAVRYFTVREAARIQTFPDRWRFEGAWSEAMRQLGNAVPMELAAVIARSVAATLGHELRSVRDLPHGGRIQPARLQEPHEELHR